MPSFGVLSLIQFTSKIGHLNIKFLFLMNGNLNFAELTFVILKLQKQMAKQINSPFQDLRHLNLLNQTDKQKHVPN